MSLPALFDRVPRIFLVLAVPLIAFLVAVALGFGTSSDNESQPAAAPTLAVSVSNLTTITPDPTATPVANRSDCNAIRGSSYLSNEERDWYQQNCATLASSRTTTTFAPNTTTTTTTTTASGGSPGYGLRGSNDRLVMKALGINAPVNFRGVGSDGQMGDPAGPTDVVWYDFSDWQGLGGYPGSGGNAVISGHVDYRNYGLAVFAPLRNVAEGDIIEYYRSDGTVITYSVVWAADIPPGGFNEYVASGGGEMITLITCNGTFNYTTREYDYRRVVRAVRVS